MRVDVATKIIVARALGFSAWIAPFMAMMIRRANCMDLGMRKHALEAATPPPPNPVP